MEHYKFIKYKGAKIEIALHFNEDSNAWEVYDVETADEALFEDYESAKEAFDSITDEKSANKIIWSA